MSYADFVNGLFEFVGGILIFNHCRVLYGDKKIRGVSKLSTGIFTSWGFWNLYYYPSLGQWFSFAGGCCIVAANFTWVSMMMYYTGVERGLKWVNHGVIVGAMKIMKKTLTILNRVLKG